jgi:putative FmdB family regulatory protein
MPIYEYSCQDCGTKFEKLVRNGAASGLRCPSCGQDHLQQEYSTFAALATGSSEEAAMCPSGMCRTPGLCGRT